MINRISNVLDSITTRKAGTGEDMTDIVNLLQELRDELSGNIRRLNSNAIIDALAEMKAALKPEAFYQYIVSKVIEMTGRSNTMVSISKIEYPQLENSIMYFDGDHEMIEILQKSSGMSVQDFKSGIPHDILIQMKPDKLHQVSGFHELMFRKLDINTCEYIVKESQIQNFYAFCYYEQEHLIGNLVIISKSELKKNQADDIEAFLKLSNYVFTQHLANERIKREQEMLTNILDLSPFIFGIFDKDGRLIKYNQAYSKLINFKDHKNHKLFSDSFCKLLGRSEEEMLGLKNNKSISINKLDLSLLVSPDGKMEFGNGSILPTIGDSGQPEYFIFFLEHFLESHKLITTLRLQEKKYQQIFNNIQDVYFEVEMDGTVIEISPSVTNYTGYDREDIIGHNIMTFYADPSQRELYIKKLLAKKEVRNYEITFKHSNGSLVYTMVLSRLIQDEKSGRQRIIGAIMDITDQKIYYQKLIESEEKFKSLFENAPMGIMAVDPKGNILDINRQMLEIIGSPSKEITVKFNVLHFEPMVKSGISDRILEAIRSGNSSVFDQHYTSHWGKSGIYKTYIKPVMNGYNSSEYILIIAEDITAKVKTDEILHETQERLNDIYEKTNDLIYTMDFEGNFTSVNPIAEKWLGFRFKDLNKPNVKKFVSLDSAKRIAENIQRKLKGETDQTTYEVTAFDSKGDKIILEINSFLRYKNDLPVEVFGIARDITERKLHEEYIQASLSEKEALVREIHHRIKNNMQLIISLIKMHAAKFTDAEIKDTFKDIHHKLLAISGVYEDLYFSQRFSSVNIKPYLEGMVGNAFDSFDRDKSICCKFNVDAIEATIDTSVPLGLIVSELTSNAIRHAFNNAPNDKEKQLSLTFKKDEMGLCSLIFSDNGQGYDMNILNDYNISVGIHMIKMLAEEQLGGTFEIENENGVVYKISFKI